MGAQVHLERLQADLERLELRLCRELGYCRCRSLSFDTHTVFWATSVDPSTCYMYRLSTWAALEEDGLEMLSDFPPQ